MSLIHDALKKAQEEAKAPIGSGFASLDDRIGEGRKVPKRTIVLAVLLLLALAFFAYTKFSSNGKPAVAPLPIAPTAQTATTVGQDVGRLKRSGADAYSADDLDAAWNSFSAALNLDPEDPETWNNLGLVARKRGDVAKSRESYDKALELKPDYPEVLNNMAVLEMQSGNNAKAKELLEKAVGILPTYPEAHFHLGLLHDQKGDRAKAVEHYKRFLEVAKSLPNGVTDSVRDRVMEIEP